MTAMWLDISQLIMLNPVCWIASFIVFWNGARKGTELESWIIIAFSQDALWKSERKHILLGFNCRIGYQNLLRSQIANKTHTATLTHAYPLMHICICKARVHMIMHAFMHTTDQVESRKMSNTGGTFCRWYLCCCRYGSDSCCHGNVSGVLYLLSSSSVGSLWLSLCAFPSTNDQNPHSLVSTNRSCPHVTTIAWD